MGLDAPPANRRWRPDLAAGTYGVASLKTTCAKPPLTLNLCWHPDVPARDFRTTVALRPMQRLIGGKALTNRNRPPPNPRRRRLNLNT